MENPNYYAIIPANVRYSFEISEFQKLLYAEITALAQKNGYCFASNTYFSKIFTSPRRDDNGEIQQRNPKAISNAINDLAKKWFIQIEIDKNSGNQRKIYIGEISFKKAKIATIHQKVDTIHENMDTYPRESGDPIHENVEHNNINITIKDNSVCKGKKSEINEEEKKSKTHTKKNKILEENKNFLENEKSKFQNWTIRFSFYQFLLEKIENIDTTLNSEKIADINSKLNEFRSRLGDDKARLQIESFIDYHRENNTIFKSIVLRLNSWLIKSI